MEKRIFCTLAAASLLAVEAPAQAPALPQTYAFTASSRMSGPMTLTVNRNGSKELIEVDGASAGVHLRVLYDFQAHRIYTTDLDGGRCTTQQYASAYAPVLWDPIGGGAEQIQGTRSLRTIRLEPVNGIAARLVEAALPEGQGKYRLWLEEKFGFPVKQAVVLGSGPERLMFEIRKISYAPPAATLFTAPAQCTPIGGVSNANGGSAEMSVEATAQGQATLGGGAAAKPAAAVQAGDPNRLTGKWDFTGKDGAGTQWRGTLTVQKLEPNSFDPAQYSNVCDLDLSSANSGKGVSNACLYDPRTKTLSLTGGEDSHKYSFTAVLSPDGASLTQGRWVEGASGTGAWSATRNSGAQPKR
jgi:hypothetical protein